MNVLDKLEVGRQQPMLSRARGAATFGRVELREEDVSQSSSRL